MCVCMYEIGLAAKSPESAHKKGSLHKKKHTESEMSCMYVCMYEIGRARLLAREKAIEKVRSPSCMYVCMYAIGRPRSYVCMYVCMYV